MLSALLDTAMLSLHHLPGHILVMNRDNGRWVLLDRRAEGSVSLLARDDDSLSPALKNRKARVVRSLEDAGLNRALQPVSGGLNTLLLKLTKVCNYACTYCYDMEPEDRMSHMREDVALAALDEAIRLAERRRSAHIPDLTVVFHGGEPTLLFPLIERLVKAGRGMAEKAGKSIGFAGQTNLSRLNGHIVEFSQKYGLSWGISLDGPAHINDQFRILRGGAGTHANFAKALAEFPEFVLDCGVLTTVTSASAAHLLDIARYFRDLGFRNWDWSLFQNIGLARCHGDRLTYSLETLIESWNRLFDAVERGEFEGFAVGPVLGYLQNFALGPGPNMCMRRECGAARDFTSVSYDGTIEACDCIDKAGPLSNIGLVQIETSTSLEIARSSPTANLIKSRDVAGGKCETCTWLTVCGGTCLAHAGTVNGVDDEQCALAMNAFPRIAQSIATSSALRKYMDSLVLGQPRKPFLGQLEGATVVN